MRGASLLLFVTFVVWPFSKAYSDSGGQVSYDNHYFDDLAVSSSTKIVSIQAPDNHKVNLPIYRKPGEKPFATCSGFGLSHLVLDCGLKPLSVVEDSAEYQFLMLAESDGWYQIYLDSHSKETVWVHAVGLSQRGDVSLISKFLKQERAMMKVAPIVGKSLTVFAEPTEASRVLMECSTFSGNDRDLMAPYDFDGDWLSVLCRDKECDSGDTSQEPRCVKGWIRWRTKAGQLQIYPQYMLDD